MTPLSVSSAQPSTVVTTRGNLRGSTFFSNNAFVSFIPIAIVYTIVAHIGIKLLHLFPIPYLRKFIPCHQNLLIEDAFRPPLQPSTDASIAVERNIASGSIRGEGEISDGDYNAKCRQESWKHIAIVTGSNTGIGFETASTLVGMGYDVILACRCRDKGVKAAQIINHRMTITGERSQKESELFPPVSNRLGCGKAIFLHPLDLSSFESVRSFVRIFQESYLSLHILVNNAGINTSGRSVDGHDLCFQTNFLGHFLLTRLLLPQLLRARNSYFRMTELCDVTEGLEAGRVVNLSSVTHHFVRTDEPRAHPGNVDLKFSEKPSGDTHVSALSHHGINISNTGSPTMHGETWWKDCARPGISSNTYKESKLAAILFSIELNKRYANYGLRAVSVNPGAVNSDIWRNYPEWVLTYVLGPIFRLLYITPEQGSRASIAAAVGKLPPGAIYLQPYWQPYSYEMEDSSEPLSFQSWYKLPRMPFTEMLGPYIGYSITDPRVPKDVDLVSSTMWNVYDDLVQSAMH